jgi:predicted dehydrogenase
MVESCEQAGVRLLVHENWRWQPWYREIRRIVDSGELGTPFHLGFRMRNGDGRGPEPYRVQPYFVEMRRFLIFETLVHFIDTFRYLAGGLKEIYCHTARINPVIAGEDAGLIRLGFQSGAEGLIDANRISGPVANYATFGHLRLEGGRGMVEMDGDGRLFVTIYGEEPREHVYSIPSTGYRGDSILALHSHFVECLQTGAPCESEGRDYLETVRAVFAAYESAEKNRVIPLS